jgi:hypothetical protein
VQTSPWVSLCIDVAALAGLCVWRPGGAAWREVATWVRALPRYRWQLGVAALAVAGVTGFAWCDACGGWLARLRGESITIDPPVMEVGEVHPGDKNRFVFQVTNWSSRPVRIFGAQGDCSCTGTEALPIQIPPGERRPVVVTLKESGTPRPFRHRVLFFTDSERSAVVDVVGVAIQGQVATTEGGPRPQGAAARPGTNSPAPQ